MGWKKGSNSVLANAVEMIFVHTANASGNVFMSANGD